jgi:hypothetical protein
MLRNASVMVPSCRALVSCSDRFSESSSVAVALSVLLLDRLVDGQHAHVRKDGLADMLGAVAFLAQRHLRPRRRTPASAYRHGRQVCRGF